SDGDLDSVCLVLRLRFRSDVSAEFSIQTESIARSAPDLEVEIPRVPALRPRAARAVADFAQPVITVSLFHRLSFPVALFAVSACHSPRVSFHLYESLVATRDEIVRTHDLRPIVRHVRVRQASTRYASARASDRSPPRTPPDYDRRQSAQ